MTVSALGVTGRLEIASVEQVDDRVRITLSGNTDALDVSTGAGVVFAGALTGQVFQGAYGAGADAGGAFLFTPWRTIAVQELESYEGSYCFAPDESGRVLRWLRPEGDLLRYQRSGDGAVQWLLPLSDDEFLLVGEGVSPFPGGDRVRFESGERAGTLKMLRGRGPDARSAVRAPLQRGELLWQPIDYRGVPARLGRLLVPEKRSLPHAPLIEIAFVMIPASAPAPEPPVVYLAGGPGGSGILHLQFEPQYVAIAERLRAIAPVIALDQRGTRNSTPWLPGLPTVIPPGALSSREEYLGFFSRRAAETRAYWQARGVDPAGYNTLETAHDVQDLCRALGVARVSLWGNSYGTRVALASARHHPGEVHRMALGHVVGLDRALVLPANYEAPLRALLARDSPGPGARPLLALMKRVWERFEASSVRVTLTHPVLQTPVSVSVTPFTLRLVTMTSFVLGGSRIDELRSWYEALDAGDHSALAPELSRLLARDATPNGLADFAIAAEHPSGARLAEIQRQLAESVLGDVALLEDMALLASGIVPDIGPQARELPRSDVPTLLLSGADDVGTPAAEAAAIGARLSRSEHLVIPGVGHGGAWFSPRARDAVVRFLSSQ